jgi:glutamate--cysteine ligase
MEFLDEINEKITERSAEIQGWIEEHSNKVLVPLYTSVDLRVSKYKIAPVDTNVFPSGFNNLSEYCRIYTANLFKQHFSIKYPKVRKILIVPELNTRNPYYWENIHVIQSMLENVGFSVKIGIVNEEFHLDQAEFKAISGKQLTAYKVKCEGHKAIIPNYVPDLILINNDFSSRCPKTLKDILQPVEPPIEIGWHTRKKNVHFEFYNRLANELAQILGLEPWVFTIDTVLQEGIDFDDEQGRERVATKVDTMKKELTPEYLRRNIDQDPFFFVKSNSGTYGMAVINVTSGDDLRKLNAEGRKRMKVTKGGKPVRDVVIQEGIPTSFVVDSKLVGEPVLYLVAAKMAGAFIRLNKTKNEFENLNTKGMEFRSLPLVRNGENIKQEHECLLPPVYQVIGSTASIAAAYEIERIIKEGGCEEETT